MTAIQNDQTADKEPALASSAVPETFWHQFRALFKDADRMPQVGTVPDESLRVSTTTTLPCGALAIFSAFVSGLVACAASAQTWQTVDDFSYTGSGINGASGVTVDPSGSVFVAGCGQATDGTFHAVIRKSSDAGGTWVTADDFTTAPTSAFYGAALTASPAIASDATGNIYAIGRYGATGGGNIWFSARSIDGGATWNNTDAAGPEAWAYGVAADGAGNVYAVGRTNAIVVTTTTTKHGTQSSTNTVFSWLVRKGSNFGTSWSTVDHLIPAGEGHATAVLCHPNLGVFVTGNGTFQLTTRRSLDGGATWVTVDDAVSGTGMGIGADALGNIYVVGTSDDFHHWLVRKSSNGGASWTTVDDYQVCLTVTNSVKPLRITTTCYNAEACGFAADSNGNLFVAGYVALPGGGNAWIVRENPGGNSSWQTVDTFQYGGTNSTQALGISADASGKVYVVGMALGNAKRWLVRRN